MKWFSKLCDFTWDPRLKPWAIKGSCEIDCLNVNSKHSPGFKPGAMFGDHFQINGFSHLMKLLTISNAKPDQFGHYYLLLKLFSFGIELKQIKNQEK